MSPLAVATAPGGLGAAREALPGCLAYDLQPSADLLASDPQFKERPC